LQQEVFRRFRINLDGLFDFALGFVELAGLERLPGLTEVDDWLRFGPSGLLWWASNRS
jgi:hypothetical protein